MHHRAVFRVLHHNPVYLLRSPDSHETPFPDVLREYNGFEPAQSWIDLRPLMELRIENAYYEKGASRRGLQGFLGTEIARYEVLSSGLQLVSVQSMQQRPPMDTPVQRLISPSVQHARYYRLYFEIVFNSTDNTHGSVLLSANSKKEIEQLSVQLSHPEKLCSQNSNRCAAFPEACSVSVEVKIFVNGRADTLVWGSRLTDVVGEHPQRLQMERLYAGQPASIKI
ncbi:MAG: hypothetical protein M3Y57_14905, partial [Acidobacteriota bacterium]|nr:hypothetical protein [Acidobacteriota bacterium]